MFWGFSQLCLKQIPFFNLWISSVRGKKNRSDWMMAVTLRSQLLHTGEITAVPTILHDRISLWICLYSTYEKDFSSLNQKSNLKVLVLTSGR